MRIFIVALSVATLGVAAYAGAQATQAPQAHIVYSPSTDVRANSIQHDKATKTTRARGQVSIQYGDSTITADEADMHHVLDSPTAVDLSIELRGNVRVTLNPSTAR